MVEAGLRLRNSYKGEGLLIYDSTYIFIYYLLLENKIHQLKTISTIPSRKRSRFTATQGVTTKKPTSLMEKARSEAIMSATRYFPLEFSQKLIFSSQGQQSHNLKTKQIDNKKVIKY